MTTNEHQWTRTGGNRENRVNHAAASLRKLTFAGREIGSNSTLMATTSNSGRFVAGFAIAAAVAVSLNFLPYVRTRGAYHGDGFEVIGFPFIFRRLGGFEGIYEFNIAVLLADIAIGAVAAVFVGYACATLGGGARIQE